MIKLGYWTIPYVPLLWYRIILWTKVFSMGAHVVYKCQFKFSCFFSPLSFRNMNNNFKINVPEEHLRLFWTPITIYCVKSVYIRSFSGLYFPVFGLNTEIYGENFRIQSECGKIRTRKTPNGDTFHAVISLNKKPPS